MGLLRKLIVIGLLATSNLEAQIPPTNTPGSHYTLVTNLPYRSAFIFSAFTTNVIFTNSDSYYSNFAIDVFYHTNIAEPFTNWTGITNIPIHKGIFMTNLFFPAEKCFFVFRITPLTTNNYPLPLPW